MKLSTTFQENKLVFAASFFGAEEKTVPASFGAIQVVTERVDPSIQYEGSYTATPKVDAQTLPTAQKFLDRDITINAIPIYETSNDANGTTVYIAKETE